MEGERGHASVGWIDFKSAALMGTAEKLFEEGESTDADAEVPPAQSGHLS
jgi:hypothetical protein